jgi:CxxC-x17-CxxC domain-containing protein
MPNEITVFAETTFRNRNRRFGIKRDDRRRHMYLVGKTGMGKSTILENMIIEDIWAGHGVAVVDPHGDLAEKVIEYIPSNRINDVIYFNPADIDYPIAFNVVEHVDPHLRHLVASGLLGVFQKLWADSWGPRLEYILRNAILAVLDYPGSTLLAVTRMLSDKSFRKKVVEKIQDPVVKGFWVTEFAGYADKFASEAVSPIQNKVGQFLSSSLIRNIVGQVKSSIDMRQIMDEGKILIMNLSKGRIGEDNSALLGSMMITKLQLAAMSRVDMAENERQDFYLYVDEFQNFATDSFANILSEARKYRLNIILAHQYIEQLPETVKFAVFGNVGTMILFRVGAADAEALTPEFSPTFMEEDIVNLPKYEFYLKLMIDGVASDPFSARGLPPLTEEEKTGNMDKVINVCRERYARGRAEVEDKIQRWHEADLGAGPRPAPSKSPAPVPAARPYSPRPAAAPSASSGRPVYNAAPAPASSHPVAAQNSAPRTAPAPSAPPSRPDAPSASCHRCGQNTTLAFVPDGIRPVYCRDCLALVRAERKQEFERRKALKEEEMRRLRPVPPRSEPGLSEPAASAKEISLSDALARPPVDFRGRPLPPVRPGVDQAFSKDPSVRPSEPKSRPSGSAEKSGADADADDKSPNNGLVFSEKKSPKANVRHLEEGETIVFE